MEINDELILKLEKLSRLELDNLDREKLKKDLENILEMIDKLKEVDTDGVEPLVYLNQEDKAWREDTVANELEPSKALQNAAQATDKYFTVPKVLDL